MTSSDNRALAQAYVVSPDAAAALDSLDSSVVELINNAFATRLAHADVDRIEVTASGKGVDFTIYIHGDRTQALVIWFGLDGEIEMNEDRLNARARRQLSSRVSIKVEALD